MVKKAFISYNPRGPKREQLSIIKNIIKEYEENKLVLTCRQIHYQLVSKNIIANTTEEYDKLVDLVGNARMSGAIDWGSIVDRNRETHTPYYEDDITDSIERTLRQYKLDRMRNQDVYIEVMIEKMAIYEIVEDVTNLYTIPLTGNKGNCSKTILYNLSKRLINACNEGKHCIIMYIGDHDPSGLKMIDSICETLSLMGVPEFELRPVALTKEQALTYNLPPNPAKDSDTNTLEYKRKYGEFSWECDALPTKILQGILRKG